MSYLHHPYSFTGHAGVPLEQPVSYDAPVPHPSMVNSMEAYIYPHPPFDMADFYPPPAIIEDYEEYAENLSRPRLTKEQVDTLEAQFQAHPKPNSNIKRQLALQTNLTLPRVANWFQNRRAKAKQQKRQEEFEKMQQEANEKAGRNRSEATDHSSATTEIPGTEQEREGEKEEENQMSTPTQTLVPSTSGDQSKPSGSASSRAKHHKTRSETIREATFASLQRALNAAVAARERYVDPTDQNLQDQTSNMEVSVHAESMFQTDERNQGTLNSAFSEWGSRDSSMSWTPSQSPEEAFEFGSLSTSQNFHSGEGSLTVPQLESPPDQNAGGEEAFGSVQFGQPASEWGSRVQTPTDTLPNHQASSDQLYSPMQFSSLQPHAMSPCRRGSSSEELADSLGSIGINTVRHSRSMQQLPHRMDGATWRHPEKELDIAARRKRPRPAAIGTSGSCRSVVGPSSMSPTTRIPSFGAGHVMRHAKSHQNLGSRSYAGVRKFSAAQRSPLGISGFAEAGVLNSANAEMGAMLPPSVSASTLAPPTPLTPEDLRHLLPSTPNESKYRVSAQHTQNQLFPTTQPMQINIASPPSTPLNVDVFSQMQYQNLAPPLSAPAHYSTFPEYSPCSSAPLTARSWADAAPIPSPDKSSFQSSIHMPRPSHISSITYEQSVDPCNQTADNWPLSDSAPVFGSVRSSNTPPAMSVTGDQKTTEFLIHEFPRQQEAHRFVAQQLPPQKPKNYTFTNQTPSDF